MNVLFLSKVFKYGTIPFLIILSSILIALNLHTCERKDKAEEVLYTNEVAYNSEIDSIKEQSKVYIKTIESLEKANDSISLKMKDVIKQLRISKSKLKQISLVGSKATKTDTIVFKDTIFKKDFKIDTTLFDEWYKLDLSMSYPSSVIVTPEFKSERYIILHHKKEYVNKPHWFPLIRLFQKKHTIVNVDVVEKSPYMKVDTLRHIEIIK